MSDAVPAAGDLPQRLRAHLGPRVDERPPPSLVEGLRAVGGFLVAAGVLVLASDQYDDSSGLALFIAFLLYAGGVAALVRAPHEFVTPAVVATGVASVGVGFFAVASNDDPSLSLAGFFVAALAGALYAVPPRRGHTFHLVVALAALWFAMLALVQGSLSDFIGISFSDAIADIGLMSVLVGGTYLAVGWWLDRAGLRAAATPFLAIGAVALAFGMFALVNDWNEVGGGLLACAVGGTIAVVGGQTNRRFTTWFGLVVLASGLIAITSGIAPDDGAVVQFLLLVLVGGGVIYATTVLADRGPLAPPADGPPPASGPDGPPPPPPPSPRPFSI
jgi:hypothetical protein